jgi:glycerol kinase
MPSDRELLGIDQGTTNTKALLASSEGEVIGRGSQPLDVSYPQPAWVEQDPLDLWKSIQAAVDCCLANADRTRIAAVAVTNQRESVVLWERRTGNPLGPCVVWQCRRTAPFCQELTERGINTLLHQRTGLTIDPLFSASKMRWLLDHTANGHERAENGELCLGTVDSWVLWNLTGGKVHACDLTNAARTQLFNLHTLDWDDELLALFAIPRAALPQLMPSNAIFGETVPTSTLPGGIPIAAMIGDSHAALFGHAGFQRGAIKATYGTGSSLLTPASRPILSQRGVSTTVAWSIADTVQAVAYALEGNISVTGAAVQWLGQLLGLANPAQEVAALAAQVDDTEGVYFVPAFVGLGAPHWHQAARGLITGLTRGSGAAQLARATVDSIAYQVRDVFEVMQAEAGNALEFLLADGGASRNDQLMQFQADILGVPVLRNSSTDVSALGAIYLAGLAVGIWHSLDEISALPRYHDRFEPQLQAERRAALVAGWQRAVVQSMHTQ